MDVSSSRNRVEDHIMPGVIEKLQLENWRTPSCLKQSALYIERIMGFLDIEK